jgi:beta-glucosidase
MASKLSVVSTGLVASCAGFALYAACSMAPDNPVAAADGVGGGTPGAGGSAGTSTAGNGGGGGVIGGGGTTGNGGSTSSTGDAAAIGTDDPTCKSFAPTRAQKFSPTDPQATSLVGQMTQQEQIATLSGGANCPKYDCDFNATGVSRLKIPDLQMRDGPRGVHNLGGGKSTTWAIAEARAASFDIDLEYRVGKAQGEEMRAAKFDVSLAPVVNTLRHPRWARAQETYGEDPVLLGEMGAAFTRGMQENVAACPKHFVGNDTDNNRQSVKVTMDEQTLRENYARPFQIIVEKADPACIMAAYNGINADWCTQSPHLLTDIVRTDWGWNGYMISDWWATKDIGSGSASLNAGLDLEMPDMRAFIGLPAAVQSGAVQGTRIVEAATRIINGRIKLKGLDPAYINSAVNTTITQDATHQALARETEEKGAVLLKNAGILPLGSNATGLDSGTPGVKKIVILGPDNALPTTNVTTAGVASGLGDRGSSNTNPPYAVSYFAGLTERCKTAGCTVLQSASAADAAVATADVVIIPVSMAHEDEGEAYDGGADRQDLTLSNHHPIHWGSQKASAFINAAAAANPNIIVLLNVGSAIVMEDWWRSAKGIVQTFYPGQEGGNAVAKLLFGDINFSGKLPFTVAQQETDYPGFQNASAQSTTDYLHGYRKFEAENKPVRFWFGYGMSYTKYDYSNLQVLCSNVSETGRLNVAVTVKNNGPMAGDEIVQLYIGYPNTKARRPPKELKTFARVTLAPGESQVVTLYVPVKDMAYWGPSGWTVEKVAHKVFVGSSADPAPPSDPKNNQLLSADFTIQ